MGHDGVSDSLGLPVFMGQGAAAFYGGKGMLACMGRKGLLVCLEDGAGGVYGGWGRWRVMGMGLVACMGDGAGGVGRGRVGLVAWAGSVLLRPRPPRPHMEASRRGCCCILL